MALVYKRWGLDDQLKDIAIYLEHAEYIGCESGRNHASRALITHTRERRQGRGAGRLEGGHEGRGRGHAPRDARESYRRQATLPVHAYVSRQYAEFRKLLGDTAKRLGAALRTNARVVDITVEPDRAVATLETGEEIAGDLLIAADGRDEVPGKHPIARNLMLEIMDEEEVAKFTKITMFKWVFRYRLLYAC